ncbi:hypothetical protein [Rhodococcus sp. ARC_M6]|uniref:hypothetical protein n=1 Tax=Rhodococcus sp. ARC_M6 TaxID=2928852 RepID=UPI001FB21EDA|nr:hypothetical protein [Rhodococcus sp. ARC_M6]MCJ0902953.1 hypothetical protein [Rhodococcus sp. ARC_M6]
MPYRNFLTYNVIGGAIWGVTVPVLGYLLGGIDFVRAHIEIILIAVVVISILPMAVNYILSLRQSPKRAPAAGSMLR